MEILIQIHEKINKYETLYETASIDWLLQAQDWFSIQNCRLSDLVADIKHEYNTYYYNRKISIAQATQSLMNEGATKGKAENNSLVENKDLLKSELDSQALAYRIELLMKQVNILINSINQRVSYLKSEKQNMSKTNTT